MSLLASTELRFSRYILWHTLRDHVHLTKSMNADACTHRLVDEPALEAIDINWAPQDGLAEQKPKQASPRFDVKVEPCQADWSVSAFSRWGCQQQIEHTARSF